MKITALSNVTPFSLVDMYHFSAATCYVHIQGRTSSGARIQGLKCKG
jgi:hypothetical protein